MKSPALREALERSRKRIDYQKWAAYTRKVAAQTIEAEHAEQQHPKSPTKP